MRSSQRRYKTSVVDLHSSGTLLKRGGLGLVLTLGMGISISSLAAQTMSPHQQAVHEAMASAERSASTTSLLNNLPTVSGAQDDSSATALPSSEAIAAGAVIEQPTPAGYSLPSNWVEAGLDISKARVEQGKLVQTLESGAKITLTIDPEVQEQLEKMYAQYKIPYGGLVILEPSTGRVLAMISQTAQGEEELGDVARLDIAPSASVFKIVTIAALVEGEGFSATKEVCYHGGIRSLTEKNIEGDPARDNRCGDLSDAMAWSINSLVAKLAYQHISREELNDWAGRFGYNQEIPFELPVAKSEFEAVKDRHEFARSAAGFWHSTLSPLHGALIGAAVVNDGVMMQPTLIERYEDPSGKVLKEFEPKRFKRVMKKSTAQALKGMMERTTSVGTARKYFRHRKDFPQNIKTGGKTGTLSRKDPSYLGYTWFVGFGEEASDTSIDVAVGGLVCNKPLWHIKGPYAASEGIRLAIESLKKKQKAGKKG